MNSNVDGLIRTAAIPEFMFLETNETSYVYEHSKTASDTLVELSQLIFSTDSKVDFDKEFNEIMSDFVVSIIPKSYDNMLNEVFKSNGPREGDSKSNYAKPLINIICTEYLLDTQGPSIVTSLSVNMNGMGLTANGSTFI